MKTRLCIVIRWAAAGLLFACLPAGPAEAEIQRLLVASLHGFGDFHKKQGRTNFHTAPEQGVFVYDINDGHRLIERFPAKLWSSWNHGWAGLAAHAPTGVLFQVQDGSGIRAYDILGKRLLWERGRNADADLRWAEHASGRDVRTRAFQYVDRRFAVTKDGKYLIVPDRDSEKRGEDASQNAFAAPVLRVLDARTGDWVKNIILVDPSAPAGAQAGRPPQARRSPHQVVSMRRYIYASQWNDGHVYCIDPRSLEVVRRIGPVVLAAETKVAGRKQSDAELLGTENEHGGQSIQHFAVDPAEKYVYVEPVKAFGLGVIDVDSGRFLGDWTIPDPAPASLRARRMATPSAEANQLHSKANHGIAVRPGASEVWITDDRWGFLHIWDTASTPPKYVEAVPVFEKLEQPIYDFSWVSFDIHGDYAYASDKVIDARTRRTIATLNGLNEACVEIQVRNGKVIRTGHDGGSGLATWVDGFDLAPRKPAHPKF